MEKRERKKQVSPEVLSIGLWLFTMSPTVLRIDLLVDRVVKEDGRAVKTNYMLQTFV